jgi:hypothetical protein
MQANDYYYKGNRMLYPNYQLGSPLYAIVNQIQYSCDRIAEEKDKNEQKEICKDIKLCENAMKKQQKMYEMENYDAGE